jgi:hypothetical protein
METAASQSSEITLSPLFRFDASENGNTIGVLRTFAHRFLAALAIAALLQPIGRAARTYKQSLATIC